MHALVTKKTWWRLDLLCPVYTHFSIHPSIRTSLKLFLRVWTTANSFLWRFMVYYIRNVAFSPWRDWKRKDEKIPLPSFANVRWMVILCKARRVDGWTNGRTRWGGNGEKVGKWRESRRRRAKNGCAWLLVVVAVVRRVKVKSMEEMMIDVIRFFRLVMME